MIRSCGNVEANASMMLNAFMNGLQPFDSIEVLADITYEDALQFLREEINTEMNVLSVVRNQEATSCRR